VNSAEACQAYPEHDCHAWNTIHYHSSPEALYDVCGVCKKVLYFRYRSTWAQILSVFGVRPWKEAK
jgi:hypothetical protein